MDVAEEGTPLAGRLLVPVLATSAGAGRSTTTALLAQVMIGYRVLVLDTAERICSPWPDWIEGRGRGVADLAATPSPGLRHQLSSLRSATDRMDVLTDVRDRLEPPLRTRDVFEWQHLAAATTHPVVLVDTREELLPLLIRWRHAEGDPLPSLWLTTPQSRSVLCVPASARGVDEALTAVTLLEELDLGPRRVTVVVVGISSSDLPRRVKAGLTLLEPRVSRVVTLPHSRHILGGQAPLIHRADGRACRDYAALGQHLVKPLALAAATAMEDTHARSTR